ncbi:MAG: alpha-glucuronidase family glycosyl hydrolase [Armatimonadota bacterium]
MCASTVPNEKAQIYKLITDKVSNSTNKTTANFKLPAGDISSARLRVKAYNDDPVDRHTVHLRIDGIGGDIAYFFTDNIADGFIPPKGKKEWVFDLNKSYAIHVKRDARLKTQGKSSFSPVEDSYNIQDISFLNMLNRPGEHVLNCWIDATDKSAPGSVVSVELIINTGKAAGGSDMNVQNIKSDMLNDLRVQLAVQKLKRFAGQKQFKGYEFVIGQSVAVPYIGRESLSDLGDEGFLIRTVPNSGKPKIVVTGTDYQGVAYGVFRLVRIMLSSPESLPHT